MAINKVKIQNERQAMKLKADVLNAQVKLEETRLQLAAKREQLRQLRATTKG
jgi:hypothetical protein